MFPDFHHRALFFALLFALFRPTSFRFHDGDAIQPFVVVVFVLLLFRRHVRELSISHSLAAFLYRSLLRQSLFETMRFFFVTISKEKEKEDERR
jgi:hypothetical protein